MKTLKLSLCFFIILTLAACTKGEFRNIVSFTDSYNEFAETKISLSDYIISDSDYIALTDKNISIVLKEADSRIYTCRVIITKNNRQISEDSAVNFRETIRNVLMAYCNCSASESLEILKALSLEDNATLSKQGELTLSEGNLYFVYYSNEITSEFRITNTYLQKIDTTEKPVSKPYYGEDFVEKN